MSPPNARGAELLAQQPGPTLATNQIAAAAKQPDHAQRTPLHDVGPTQRAVARDAADQQRCDATDAVSRDGALRLTAHGVWYPPSGRRHLGAVVVPFCPACAHLHLHRAVRVGSVDGHVRVGSCGAAYVLSVLHSAEAAS
jgi:hypothetical protein